MNENFFDKNTDDNSTILLNIVPPKLEKHPLTLDITPRMATILELIVKTGAEQKITFEELVNKAKELEGNQALDENKVKLVLEKIRSDLKRLGIVNGLLILPTCVILKSDIQLKKTEQSDDLLDFIYRDLVQNKPN